MIFKTLKANYMKEHKITVQIFVDILKIIALIVTLFPYRYHKNSTLLIVFKDNSNILSCRKKIKPYPFHDKYFLYSLSTHITYINPYKHTLIRY